MGTTIANLNSRDPDFIHMTYLFSFILFTVVIVLSYIERPIKTRRKKDKENVVVIVPVYNEDGKILRNCLRSLLNQTRKPDKIFVVDDGSNKVNYAYSKRWFKKESKKYKVETVFIRQRNTGKRGAQASAIRNTPEATIYVTIDSDSMLDHNAIFEGLKPFVKRDVKAVAGLFLILNNKRNLLTRLTDLMFVTGQLIDRSSMSSLSSVLVNSGSLAFYRANIIKKNLNAYLNEKFFNMDVKISDDSMLTLFALQEGKTVQQSSAVVFSMMPERLDHHIRQQVRWQRGSFIRSFWRIKYLPILSYGFARQFISWISQVVGTLVVLLIIFAQVLSINPDIIVSFILISIVTNYIQTFKYLTVHRSDESIGYRIVTFLFFTPLISLWSMFVLKPVRIYSILTCLKSGWGTRNIVEVKI